MRTRLRGEEPGAIYHVYARGVDRRRIFVDDSDYESYTRLLAGAAGRYGWHLLAYCLMPNHVHLMIETPETTLGAGMQWLHSRHAIAFNRRHSRSGHLFESRYRSPIVRTDETYVRLVGYITRNPLTAGLCKRASEWPWGSHAFVNTGHVPRWLAHSRMLERLEATTGTGTYPKLVSLRDRR